MSHDEGGRREQRARVVEGAVAVAKSEGRVRQPHGIAQPAGAGLAAGDGHGVSAQRSAPPGAVRVFELDLGQVRAQAVFDRHRRARRHQHRLHP
jgi:hypothetical protein